MNTSALRPRAPQQQAPSQQVNPVKALFSGVGKAEIGPARIKGGRYLLRINDVILSMSRNSVQYIRGHYTVLKAYFDENNTPYGAEGYIGHEPGEEVSTAIFPGDYFAKEMKLMVAGIFNIHHSQVADDDALILCGFNEQGEVTGNGSPARNMAVIIDAAVKAGKAEEGKDPKMFVNPKFVRTLPEHEVLAELGDEEVLKESFPEGVNYFDPNAQQTAATE